MTDKPYSAMNAREKTEYIGFKCYSERELKDRTTKATARRTEAVKRFLTALVTNPAFIIGKGVTEKELEPAFKEAINYSYDEGVKLGLTTNDLEAVEEGIIQIAYMFRRTRNEANTEIMRLGYALTGENNLGDVPLKDVIALSKVAKDLRPKVASEYDEEPSLSQSTGEVVVPVEEAK
jgi:hypothetical protein